MAWQTKSIVGDGANGHHRFTLNITEDSININTNQSYISWSLVLSPLGNGWDWNYANQIPVTYLVNINGVRCAEDNIMSYDGRSTVTVASGGMYIQHNPDGYKDIDFNFSIWSMNVSYLPGSASASGTMSLTYIPRQATITSAPNFTDEENPTITFSNPAGNAVDKLGVCIVYYDAAGVERRITINDADDAYGCYIFVEDKTSTQYTFELSQDERNNIYNATPDKNSLLVYFYVTTWIGSEKYHSFLQRTVTIVNADPVIDDTNVLALGRPGTVISGCNYMEFSFTAHGVKNASIAKRTVTCGNKTVEINDENYGALENVTSGDFIFTAIDSRGNDTSIPVSLDYIPYIKPTCNIKVDMDVVQDTEAKAKLTISGKAYGGYLDNETGTQNMSTVFYRWKAQDDAEYGDWISIDSNHIYDYSYEVEVTGLNDHTTYVFQAMIFDDVYTEDIAILSAEYVDRAIPLFDYGDDDFSFNVPITVEGQTINERAHPTPDVLYSERLGSESINVVKTLAADMSNYRTIEVLYSCNHYDHYVQTARMRVGYRVGWNIGDALGNILPCYDGSYMVFYFPNNTTIRLDNATNNNHIIAIYGWKY